jgi:hypothetical protein
LTHVVEHDALVADVESAFEVRVHYVCRCLCSKLLRPPLS